MVWVWKISPKSINFFNFFPYGSKKSLCVWSKSTQVKGSWPLIYCGSKESSDQDRAHLYQRHILLNGNLILKDSGILIISKSLKLFFALLIYVNKNTSLKFFMEFRNLSNNMLNMDQCQIKKLSLFQTEVIHHAIDTNT